MILPIISYGTSILKRKAQEVDLRNPNLKKNIEDMWETMYAASGVGIAAPQVGLSLRLFLVDGTPFYEDDQIEDNYKYQLKNLKKVFINPKIIETGKEWCFNEGCLSIPDIREDMLTKGNAGIRAQLMNNNGELIQDFDIRVNGKIVSILNAPSPAATSSLAIAKYIVEFLEL